MNDEYLELPFADDSTATKPNVELLDLIVWLLLLQKEAQRAARIEARAFVVPSPQQVDQIEALMSRDLVAFAAGIADFGISYPPPIGWRSYLNGIWHWEGSSYHDTVFDEEFRLRWLRIGSGTRVPLANIRKENAPS